MTARHQLMSFAVLAVLLVGTVPGVNSCGIHEDLSSQSLTCTTTTQTFTSYGPRVEINGTFMEMAFCNSDGNCQSNDPSRFTAVHTYDSSARRHNVTLHITEVDRSMTRARCYTDGFPQHEAECPLGVYVVPNKPTCAGPEFVNGGRTAVITCTSERVYPTATCGLRVKVGGEKFEDNHRLSVSDSLTASDQYPGDRELTCRFTLDISGIAESRYTFGVIYYPPISDPPQSTIKEADAIPPLDLEATALYNPGDNNRNVDFNSVSNQLKLDISVSSNPPPYIFSLSLKDEQDSTRSTPVSRSHYSVTYRTSQSDSQRGTIQLTLAASGAVDGQRFNFFKVTADNGVVGDTTFEYFFTAERHDIPPTQASCETPTFVDGGANAVITCTSDRIYPTGSCDFKLVVQNLILATQPTMVTKNSDSTLYPGDKKVMCELRMPVVGNRGGTYQFRVEISPTNMLGNLSTHVTTPTVNLKPTTLYNPAENNHVFGYPESGELNIDVHVTGNPAPNRVTLWVQRDQTSSRIPVSSRDFTWEYVKSVGSDIGLLQLSVRGDLGTGSVIKYTLEAGNGVVGATEFEYKFTVQDDKMPPTPAICGAPEFVDGGATALITCTSDRISFMGICNFRLLTNDLSMNEQPSIKTRNEDSTAYPGNKKVTCDLRMPVAGNRGGAYQFRVEISPTDMLGNLSTHVTTPTVNLKATALYNPGDKNRNVDFNPMSNQLKLDISVTSNPPPYIFSLSLRDELDSTRSTPVSISHYSVTYRTSESDSQRGTIQLTLAASGAVVGQRFNFFKVTADNGVVGDTTFEYFFTAERHDTSCETPTFVDGGANAVITCTSDRIYPTGSCDFKLVVQNLILATQPTMVTRNSDSTLYPGDKKVTCDLRLPVAGNRDGAYQFRVEISPTNMLGNLSTHVTTPTVNLNPTTLYNPAENNHVFGYPESGELNIDVHVTGNPAPNRVTLWVQRDQTSSRIPVSSRDFTWEYVKSVGSDIGLLQLSVRGDLGTGSVIKYTLEAGNGVVGATEFEYKFTVQDDKMPPTPAICGAPEFVDGGATALITCTSDRVSSMGICNFRLLTNDLSLNEQPSIKTRNEDSTAYPGNKKVTCDLRMPVAGNRGGAYQFRVEISPTNMLGNLSTHVTTPTVNLNPTALYEPTENNHVFNYPESGELNVDVHVTGNPEPNRVTLAVRHGETTNRVPVSSRDFRWAYDKTVGSESGVIQLSVMVDGVSEFTLMAENGVVGGIEFEYKFSVLQKNIPPADSRPKTEESSDNNLPLIIGAAAGGVVFIGIIIVVVVVLMRKRRSPQQDSPPEYPRPPFDPPGYIYPNMAFNSDGEERERHYATLPPYSTVYETDRPVSTFSEPEYTEVDEPTPAVDPNKK